MRTRLLGSVAMLSLAAVSACSDSSQDATATSVTAETPTTETPTTEAAGVTSSGISPERCQANKDAGKITYLTGFRKHEQGNNAVEIAQFDPLVEQIEAKIDELKQQK